ncbi:MAG: DUF58 domain-containing protein [bacterium]
MAARAALESRFPAAAPQEIPRIRAEGVVFLVLTFAVGLAAMNTGNNVLYLVLAMMLAFFLVSGILALSTLRRVSGTRRLPGRIHAGEPVLATLVLRNDKRWLASFALECTDSAAGGKPVLFKFVPEVPARGEVELTAEYRFERRGVARLPGLRIGTRFPFGFIERGRRVPVPLEVLVWPRLDRSSVPGILRGLGEGGEPSHRKGMGEEIHSIRPFQHGDSPRHISWKHSGRTGALLVRDFEMPAMQRITLVLDLAEAAKRERREPNHDPEIEAAISRAAGIATELVQHGFAVRLATHGIVIAHGTGPSHVDGILEALARLDPYGPILAPLAIPEPVFGEPAPVTIQPTPPVRSAAGGVS